MTGLPPFKESSCTALFADEYQGTGTGQREWVGNNHKPRQNGADTKPEVFGGAWTQLSVINSRESPLQRTEEGIHPGG
jgi:hypothetical protein